MEVAASEGDKPNDTISEIMIWIASVLLLKHKKQTIIQ